jgi:ergothioneine biosynthesis protein EgtB
MVETMTDRLTDAWARTDRIFEILAPGAWLAQPIALRHPFIFYLGHLPAFAWNHVGGELLGRPAFNPGFDELFSRGIDPDVDDPTHCHDHPEVPATWPAVPEVLAYRDRVRAALLDAGAAVADRASTHLMAREGRVFAMVAEHELMHQETLLYIWHRLPFDQKRKPAGYQPRAAGESPRGERIEIPAGCATLGVAREAHRFGWDNEHPATSANVPAFAIDRHDVTNERYLEFVDAGGYRDPQWWRPEDWAWLQREAVANPLFWERDGDRWLWRGMFDLLPLPPAWPVYLSQAEASAYARWRGARLPTEAEFQRAAYGSPSGERVHPWGDAEPDETRGVFDFSSWDPEAAGSHPKGASAWGVEDLVGNGWEWTSTVFGPFSGFRAMPSYPEYSADFFDGDHVVMKGASMATAKELLRPSFRNWFRARYPYVYATFRCAT